MGAIFANLHDQGVDQQQLLKCVEEIPITDGMKELLQHASQKGHECIIISDSNSKFINQILQRYNLEECVSVVYTNPASFDENGILTIEKYHTQNWCDMSTVNLCKGNVLEQHITSRQKAGVQFSCFVYVGDGWNDLCPSLRLEESDYICARANYRLCENIRKIQNGEQTNDKHLRLKANVLNWRTGFDVLNLLKQIDGDDMII